MLTDHLGDCLFNALSDQLHGDDSKAAEYRANVVEYMRANKDDYTPFIGLLPGGATRRNPKRKTAGSLGRQHDNTAITGEQVDAAFEKRMAEMAQGGTWGDNHEIVAFSKVYEVDINIWSEAINNWFRVMAPNDAGKDKPTLYVVHHVSASPIPQFSARANQLKDYAHYSSIRNLDGPFKGLPYLQTHDKTEEGVAQMKRELAEVEDWRIDTVMKALPFPLNQSTNRANVQKRLEHCNGNMDDAVSILLPDSSPGSTSPSSIERDPDSDDEKEQNPNKKRDRRASRPHPLRSNLAVPVAGKDSVILSPDPIRLATALKKVSEEKQKPFDPDETEEENWKDDMMYKDSASSSGSSYSRYSTPPPKAGNTDQPKIRLKLSRPRAQQNSKNKDAGSISSSYSSQSNLADAEADAEEITEVVKKEPQLRVIAKPKRRLISGYERARLMQEKVARDSDNDSTSALSRANLMARNNSMKKLDSSIEAIHI